jgi:hypothetical protein
VVITTLSTARWHIDDATRKLACRARLPGARVFDLAAASIRRAKDQGLPATDRLHLALPASWLVNSPAVSPVLRRWALPPQRDAWLALVGALESPSLERDAMLDAIRRLGDEAYAIEAISKVAALIVPDVVPLMPAPARAFVMGEAAGAGGAAFVAMVSWFSREAGANAAELEAIAKQHEEVPLSGAQVLDRLLWFDSEGYQHFQQEGFTAPKVTQPG